MYLAIVRNIPYRREEYTLPSRGIYLTAVRNIPFYREEYTLPS